MAKTLTIDYYISAQPDVDYYVWQLQVQMNNFKRLGIEEKAIILMSYDPLKGINKNALDFSKQTAANVYFYPDQRQPSVKTYIPSIRPNILKQFYKEHGKMVKSKTIMYHDSDIIFNRLPSIESKGNTKTTFVSDTISYVGAEYVKSKGERLFTEMCQYVGIDPKVVESNEKASGGAQYLISKYHHLDYEFWNKVEWDSAGLYRHMTETSHIYSPNHPIQAWTADMWAVLWNLWLRGYNTQIDNEMDFSWATSVITEWDRHPIFHNAGVTGDRNNLFYKGAFIAKNPFNENFDYVSDQFCSYKYVEEIIDTGKNLKIRKK